MKAPQCDHREMAAATMGGSRLGRRCTKRSYYHASNKIGEGGANFCRPHGLQRASSGVKLTILERRKEKA